MEKKKEKKNMAVNPAEGASPPVFEQIFRNARFAQGGNALFEGKVKGNPRPQVVWTRKGLQMKRKCTILLSLYIIYAHSSEKVHHDCTSISVS